MAEHARAKEISRIRIHLSPMRLCTCLCLSEARLLSHVTSQPLLESPPLDRKTRAQPVSGENSILIRLSLSFSFFLIYRSNCFKNTSQSRRNTFFSLLLTNTFRIILHSTRDRSFHEDRIDKFFSILREIRKSILSEALSREYRGIDSNLGIRPVACSPLPSSSPSTPWRS